MRRKIKLTTLYYQHIVPVVLVLLLAGIVSSYFLVRRILQGELDAILERSKSRIENYIRVNHRLPEINTFDDQLILFRKAASMKDSVYSDAMQYIPEQQKYHISRKLIFTTLLNGEPWEVTVTQPLEGTRHLTILIVQMAIVTISVTLLLFMLIIRRIISRSSG
jgi:hypothetical protein